MSVHLKKREIIIKNGRNRASRPKTYESEAKAQAAAKAAGLTKFTIVNLKNSASKSGKYKIVA